MARFSLAHLSFLAPAGGQFDAPEKEGMAVLNAALLEAGTKKKTAPQIADHVEQLGASLATGADWDVAYLGISLLSDYLTQGLELLAELSGSPTFPDDEVERLRQRHLDEIRNRRHEPSALAYKYFSRAIYEDSAYGNPLIGSEESLGSIHREDLLDFYQMHFTAEGSAIVVVGDLDPDRVFTEIETTFTTLGNHPAPTPPEIHPPDPGQIRVHVVDRPQATQTELRLGNACVSRLHPDCIPLRVLNSVLGGKFTSRINLNLRERHGYTYGAYSRFVERLGPGPFVVSAAVATDVAGRAVSEIHSELTRIQQKTVPEEELEETKSYLLGVFPYTLQTVGGFANRLEELAVYDLADDYFSTYPASLHSVTSQDLLRVAGEHIHPDTLTITAVGPARSLVSQLEAIGSVEVFEPTAVAE